MQNKNYIDNTWVDALDGKTFDVENPFTEETISKVPYSSAKDIDLAVQSAKKAWKHWTKMGSLEMRDLMREVAVKSRANDREIAEVITSEIS